MVYMVLCVSAALFFLSLHCYLLLAGCSLYHLFNLFVYISLSHFLSPLTTAHLRTWYILCGWLFFDLIGSQIRRARKMVLMTMVMMMMFGKCLDIQFAPCSSVSTSQLVNTAYQHGDPVIFFWLPLNIVHSEHLLQPLCYVKRPISFLSFHPSVFCQYNAISFPSVSWLHCHHNFLFPTDW